MTKYKNSIFTFSPWQNLVRSSHSSRVQIGRPALISLHWLRVQEHISFKPAVTRYRSIHSTSSSYLQSCFIRVSDMTSRRRLRSSTSHRLDLPPVRLSTVLASGSFRFLVPPSGTTCLSTSHVHRHSRFSDNDSRPFCFPVPTKTLSYNSCVTIIIHRYCLDNCRPCNN